jgi:hypothetical protein
MTLEETVAELNRNPAHSFCVLVDVSAGIRAISSGLFALLVLTAFGCAPSAAKPRDGGPDTAVGGAAGGSAGTRGGVGGGDAGAAGVAGSTGPAGTPANGVAPQTATAVFPAGDISFLHGISAIGDKFLAPTDLGPQGQRNAPNGTFEGTIYLRFGDTIP